MSRKKRPFLALVAAALALTASGYAATGGVHGIRSNDRPDVSNGHCGHSDRKPPCRNHGPINGNSADDSN
jgi:hypothetical protein